MFNAKDSRTESSNPLRVLAAVMFMVMVGSGYAVSTQVGAVDQDKVAMPSVPDQAKTEYFPAQFANQRAGGVPEEHVQNF